MINQARIRNFVNLVSLNVFLSMPSMSWDHENKVDFLLLLQRFWIQTYWCDCPQWLPLFRSFRILVECNPNRHGQRVMLARPNRLLSDVLSTLDQCCVSSQPVLSRRHTQTRMVLFSRLPETFRVWNISEPCSSMVHQNHFQFSPTSQGFSNISQIAKAFHRISPPLMIQARYCNNTPHVPSFHSAYRSFSNTY